MKGHVQNSEVVGHSVTPEHLHGDDERVLEQVAGRERDTQGFTTERERGGVCVCLSVGVCVWVYVLVYVRASVCTCVHVCL